ncbi:hypothetical protein P5673_005900 [Acropora cervicornis]|uniref:Uncharacterized protein n=1 Tax=Acropora cervicornis TaxID=6130 RepID=A0AAD9QXN1_ACRCE|nr:hypothetical protein P5673_005900 [Acropora cervicornis]
MREMGNYNGFIPHLPQLATLTGRTNDNLVSTAIFSMSQSKMHVYLMSYNTKGVLLKFLLCKATMSNVLPSNPPVSFMLMGGERLCENKDVLSRSTSPVLLASAGM